MLHRCAVVLLFVLCLFTAAAASAQNAPTWSPVVTVSATTTLQAGRICYTDGRDIICDTSAPLLGGLIASETLAIDDLKDAISNSASNTIFIGQAGTSLSAAGANNTGTANIGIGIGSMANNTIGSNNVALGTIALFTNVSGTHNTAIGSNALYLNKYGSFNTAVGRASQFYNTGDRSVSIGVDAIRGTSGSTVVTDTVAVGYQAGRSMTIAASNTLIGAYAGNTLFTGSNNVLIGYNANAPTNSTNNYVNVANSIYGDSSINSYGIGTAPSTAASLTVAGTISATTVKVAGSATAGTGNPLCSSSSDYGRFAFSADGRPFICQPR